MWLLIIAEKKEGVGEGYIGVVNFLLRTCNFCIVLFVRALCACDAELSIEPSIDPIITFLVARNKYI